MKKITVIIIRKIFPAADDKTVIFLGAGLVALATALWGPFMEIWEALHQWKDYSFDFWHIFDSHAPAIGGAMFLFWNTMKAANLIPDILEDVPMTVQDSTVKIAEHHGQPPTIIVSQETHTQEPTPDK